MHRGHPGHGYGKAITVAAAAALQELASSSAIVCTPRFYLGAVAIFKSAGLQQLPEIRDRYRFWESDRRLRGLLRGGAKCDIVCSNCRRGRIFARRLHSARE